MFGVSIRGLCVGMLCCALASPAAAQEEWPGEDTAYRDSIRKALAEYRRGNWAEAKSYFTEAHTVYPNARTLRGLGLTAYALRDYVTAIAHLEASLASPIEALSPSLREQISTLLAQARRFVTRMVIELDPSDAELLVDQRTAVRTADGSVWLNPGTHDLEVIRTGYESATRRIWVQADTEISVRIALRREGDIAPPAQVEPAAPPSPPVPLPTLRHAGDARDGPTVAPFILLGVSSAVAITGGVLVGAALHDIGRLERPAIDTQWSDVERKYRNTPALSTAGFALIGVGVAGIGASLLWAFWPDAERESKTVSVRWTGRGVSVGGVL